MAENQTSNVVPIGGRDNPMTTPVSDEAASLLSTCRDRLVQGVTTVFAQHVGPASDELLGLADRATNLEQQQVCFTANGVLVNRTQELLQEFRVAYVARFDASLTDLTRVRPGPDLQGPDELSLIDTDEFEQDLAIGKLAARATFNCLQQLVALERRLGALLRLQRVSQDDNPLYPGALFDAMLQALSDLGVGQQPALILVQAFERHTAAELPGLYADLNRFLAQSGVLPTIPLGSPQQTQGPAPADDSGTGRAALEGARPTGSDQWSAPPDGADPNLYGTGRAGGPSGGAPDVFSQLLQAIQTANAIQQASGGAWRAGAPAMPAADSAPQPATVSLKQLVDALGDLQHGRADPGRMPGLGSTRIDPGQDNVLQQIRSTPLASWSHPMDALTIDIVSMLFDAIFNDPELPATLRAEIAKLQIPVLKVALLDKAFFSDRRHPARRLIDSIANSGIGRSERDELALVEKVRAIVESVVRGFESDMQVFSLQADQLEGLLQEEDERAQGRATRMVDELELNERKEVAAGRVKGEIERRINRRQIPSLVADFLSRNWQLVLVDVFVRTGDASDEWGEAVRLMDELLWSLEPKTGMSERDRLLVLLPDMLKRLRGGLERVQLHEGWDAFFSELIRLHMAALHKGAPAGTGAAGRDLPPRSESSDEIPDGSETGSEQSWDPQTQSGQGAQNQQPSDVQPDRHLRLVEALEVGAWVEFQSFRGTRNTLRLSWVSEFKRVYLFTNRQGENAMTLAASSLVEHLRKGSARLLSQDPLTDRAVAQVLEKVRPASAGPSPESPSPGFAWE